MNDAKHEFMWKINTRKIAKINTGNTSFDEKDNSPLGYNVEQFMTLSKNIDEANSCKEADGYHVIRSNRKFFGSLIVFSKKVIRKLINIFLGWYIQPIFERQTYFNGKAINSLNLLKDIAAHQQDKINGQTEKINEKTEKLKEQTEKMNEQTEKMNEQTEKLNEQTEKMNEQTEKLNEMTEKLNEQTEKLNEQTEKMNYVFSRLGVTCDLSLLGNNNMDYFEFEDKFRGTREYVKETQRNYLDYFRTNSGREILDIGCGRGEFLELMQDAGIPAFGVDCYQPYVKFCTERGFRAHEADALTFLSKMEDNSLGGIFMAHVVEHLSNDYVMALINMAYRKLISGCYFILETPNPDSLAAISNFNIDISHMKPVHPKSLEFLFRAASFQGVTISHTAQSKYPVEVHHIHGENITNLDDFNQGIDHINDLLFGFQDYSLIARK